VKLYRPSRPREAYGILAAGRKGQARSCCHAYRYGSAAKVLRHGTACSLAQFLVFQRMHRQCPQERHKAASTLLLKQQLRTGTRGYTRRALHVTQAHVRAALSSSGRIRGQKTTGLRLADTRSARSCTAGQATPGCSTAPSTARGLVGTGLWSDTCRELVENSD